MSGAAISPALKALAEACRLGASGATGGRAGLGALAERHGVSGFYAASIDDRAGIEQATAHSLTQLAECQRIGEALDGMPQLFLKGLATAALAHCRPLLKSAADIDLLVRPADRHRAATILAALGYRRLTPATGIDLDAWHRVSNQSVWQAGPHIVELHDRAVVLDGPWSAVLTVERSQQAEVMPGTTLPTFSDAEQFAYLALHGAIGGWFRLKWLADLAGFLARREDRVADFYQFAKTHGAGSAAGQSLLLVQALFGLRLSPTLADEIERSPRAKLLARSAFRLLGGGEPTERAFGTLQIHVGQWLVSPSLTANFRHSANLLRMRFLA